jgi:hypothetical protein
MCWHSGRAENTFILILKIDFNSKNYQQAASCDRRHTGVDIHGF